MIDTTSKIRSVRSNSRSALRIVHLTTVHQPFDPRIFHKQLRSLREAGFDTHLIAPHDKAECRNGVTIHPLSEPQNRGRRLLLQPNVFQTARDLGGELYQIHDPELLPLAFLLKKTTGATVIYDMHEDYRAKGPWVGSALRTLENWGFRWVDHVLLAEKSYQSIVKDSTADSTYIANYFKPLEEDEETKAKRAKRDFPRSPRLLYTGTVSNSRGLRTMLDLASEIRRGGFSASFDIVGICRYPTQRAEAEQRIGEDGLSSIVNRVGWDTYVPPSRMPSHYRRAHVGLALCEPHPNLVGSLLTKFYEYLHYGLPIICSDFPLWRDFVDENGCGEVVPPGDVGAVLDVLSRWADHPEVYREHVRNAQTAADKYNWKKMGDRLVQVYRDLLSTDQE